MILLIIFDVDTNSILTRMPNKHLWHIGMHDMQICMKSKYAYEKGTDGMLDMLFNNTNPYSCLIERLKINCFLSVNNLSKIFCGTSSGFEYFWFSLYIWLKTG